MKKQLLIGAALLASAVEANAQVVVTQDFETSAAGWNTRDLDGDGEIFQIFDPQNPLTAIGFTGNVAGSQNFTVDPATQAVTPLDATDNVLTSPLVPVPAGASYMSMRLGSLPLTGQAGANYAVYVITLEELQAITNDQEFAAHLATMTPSLTGSITNTSQVFSFDMSSYAGKQVMIGIRQHDQAGKYAYLFVDDITLNQGVMGLNDHLLSTMSVYPNPTTDFINVSTEAVLENVTVTDLNGRIVKSIMLDNVSDAVVYVSDLTAGIYMLTVSSDRGTAVKKFIKN